MYTNVIATAFKRVATVEEACEIYDGFKLLAKRPKVQRFLEKKAGDVWRLFSQARICCVCNFRMLLIELFGGLT